MQTLESGMLLKSRYKIEKTLGQGGMGEVYLAIDESLDTKVAVKANHNLSAHASAQFIREARLLASLKHPNLPRVIDYFTENESQFLVMDYIPGENLKVLVEDHHEISTELVLKWASQLGNAINYLHTQNPPIFHRDIKPANIKLTPAGEVILVDFGIAKTGDPSQETQTGAWAFTPGFAPPEQVSGMRTGPYSDQFSLAATLYYLITGKSPADSARRLMGEEELVPLIDLKPKIAAHVSGAITKALAIKPEARFSTVDDFIGALSNPHPIPDPASVQQTIVVSNRSTNQQSVPPLLERDVLTPPLLQKKSPVLTWVLVLGVILVLIIGGYFGARTLGFFGTPELPSTPTSLPEGPTSLPVIETPLALTSTPTFTPSPSETATSTPETAIFTPIGRGGKVAFISNRQADGYNQVWIMDVGQDGSGNLITKSPQQLTFTPGDKSNPSWSPDGTTLLFSGFSTGFSTNGSSFADDIWALDITQNDPQPVDLSLRPGDDKYPAWSPTGKVIAFTSYYREDKLPQIFTMRPDGNDQIRLSLGYSEAYSSWTPNGDFLFYVYTSGQLNVLYMRDRYSLFKNNDKFDRTTNEGRLGNVAQPNVSLDGANIVYTRLFGERTDIFTAVVQDRGRTITGLTDSGKDYSPFWSPDSKWIVFTSERDGDAEIYIMDSAGGNITNLTHLPSLDKDPAWQPAKIQ
ncbi:MAG: protein kinase [Chloroflexi bacterium]|nr:protein kinase [Chloroflexota bacterium]